MTRAKGPWFKVKIGYHAGPRFRALNELAELWWLRALDFAAAHQTDGLITDRQARGLVQFDGWTFEGEPVLWADVRDALTASGLVDRADDGTLLLHDYLDWNSSREHIAEVSALRSEVGKRGGRPPVENQIGTQTETKTEPRSRSKKKNPPTPPGGDAPSARSEPEPTERRRRATTLPPEFTVTDTMRAWARERVPAVNIERQTEVFRNYWLGEGKTKIDWPATWRNSMLSAQQRAEERGWRAPPIPAQVDNPVDDYEARLRGWLDRTGTPMAEYQDNRDDPGWVRTREQWAGAPVPVQ